MYLNGIIIKYINSMTRLTMEDIRNNCPEDREIYSSVLTSYFKFLSNLRKDSNEFKYAKYSWFVELREIFMFNDTTVEEIIEKIKRYFLELYNYSYENIPFVIKECFNSIDDDFMADKIYEKVMELFESKLNLEDFEQSEEFQNAVCLFLNKHTIKN